jgi:hypothetical protein
MPVKIEEFKIKLKNCKSLEDYRLLAEEYNIQDERSCSKYRAYILRKIIREGRQNLQVF